MTTTHRITAAFLATFACTSYARAQATNDTPMEPWAEGAPRSPQPVPPDIPPPNLTTIAKPIPSPLHPRHRLMPGFTLAAGVYCPNFSSRSVPWGSWCSPRIHLAVDGPFMDAHADLLYGDVLGYAGMLGFDAGTKFMQLGNRRQRVALAIRGSFDVLLASVAGHLPGYFDDGLLTFSNTYGPHLSIALTPRSSLEIRGSVGWTVGSFYSNQEGFNRPLYGFVADGWIGMRLSP